MSILGEYIGKRLSANQLETELLKLIADYNKKTNSFLLVYASSFSKNIPEIPLSMDDYFVINDILSGVSNNRLDFYIESPGGSAEAAEEIVECIHSKFDNVSFIISGEAKSAGTILVMSGNEICMTESGSLGPIDAQVKIGRMFVSAHDYMEWVKSKREEAEKMGKLNPFDATMVAQISPGELNGVYHALNFAIDLIKEWLPKYKFRDWNRTETRLLVVTETMKKDRAEEIARELVDHSKWRSHGRSLKIHDLKPLLRINRIDDDIKLAEIVYRIQAVIRLLLQTTSTFKIFATANEKIFRNAVPQIQNSPIFPVPQKSQIVEAEIECPQCKKKQPLYGKFVKESQIDIDLKKKGKISIISQDKITCTCGFVIDLIGIRNELENKIGKKFV